MGVDALFDSSHVAEAPAIVAHDSDRCEVLHELPAGTRHADVSVGPFTQEQRRCMDALFEEQAREGEYRRAVLGLNDVVENLAIFRQEDLRKSAAFALDQGDARTRVESSAGLPERIPSAEAPLRPSSEEARPPFRRDAYHQESVLERLRAEERTQVERGVEEYREDLVSLGFTESEVNRMANAHRMRLERGLEERVWQEYRKELRETPEKIFGERTFEHRSSQPGQVRMPGEENDVPLSAVPDLRSVDALFAAGAAGALAMRPRVVSAPFTPRRAPVAPSPSLFSRAGSGIKRLWNAFRGK